MNRNSLRPMYPKLTGEERLRLAMQAGASGDGRECMHLLNSCPRVEGTAVDPSFTTPALASYRLASAFARAFGPFLGWLNLVSVLEGLLNGEKGRAFLAREAQLPVAIVLDRAAEGAARRLRALADAFEEVCLQRAGLPPAVLLSFWDPEAAAALQASEDWIQDLEADPGAREEFKARLDYAWTLGS